MEKELKDGLLTIRLEGRIDSNNAPDVEKELTGILEEAKADDVVFDAEGLEYISRPTSPAAISPSTCRKTAFPGTTSTSTGYGSVKSRSPAPHHSASYWHKSCRKAPTACGCRNAPRESTGAPPYTT